MVFGDAIRAFYGLPVKGNGTAKDKVAPEENSAQNGPERPLLAQVRARLEESNISEPEFLDILRCAQIAEAANATSLSEIPDKTIRLAIGSWDTVVELAIEFRKRKDSKQGSK